MATTETLRRLLVSRQMLASHEGRHTSQSDAIAVAQTILTTHDATELTLAAIATETGADVKDRATLMDYPAPIAKAKASGGSFPGRQFLNQLNRVRGEFKHAGILPNVSQWYRVAETASTWLNQWCATYLDVDFSALQPDDLLNQDEVRELYRAARVAYDAGQYREVFENIGRALLCVLEGVPRIWLPTIGKPDAHRALLLTAFGVSASQLLTLEDFLPTVSRDLLTRDISLTWETRLYGHPANWRQSSSKFCLDTFLDLALKVQHAEPLPLLIPFEMVYEDVITAKSKAVELWHYDHSGGRSLLSMPTKGGAVFVLRPAEKLRCQLSPSPYEVPLRQDARNPVTVESAQILEVRSKELPDGVAYVEREFVDVSFEERNDAVARRMLREDV